MLLIADSRGRKYLEVDDMMDLQVNLEVSVLLLLLLVVVVVVAWSTRWCACG